ncbi:MAG: thioredoxin domain-containing protein [Deltaproteobacteria bacterium]|nr:thioredoxin domain-containing protein [Deltaproteobacteria bacterium]
MGSSTFKKFLLVLLLLGVYFSIELLTHHTRLKFGYQFEPSACAINNFIDCDAVAKSRYAELLGIPMASYALVYYIILMGLYALQCFLNKRDYYSIFLFISGVGFIWSIAMSLTSFLVIKKICIYCFSLYLVNIVIFVGVYFSRLHHGSFAENVRCWWRTLTYGLKALFSSAIPDQHRSISRFSLIYVCLTIGVVYLLPFYLVLGVYVPRAESEKNKGQAESSYSDWLKEPMRDLELATGDFLQKDFAWGDAQAAITIVEFSDFECPFCRRTSKFLKELESRYPGKIRIVFKNFPLSKSCNANVLTEKHAYACEFAYLARCAGKYGDAEFWKMHDEIMGLLRVSAQSSSELIDDLDLDKGEMASCIRSPEVRQRIMADSRLGNRLAINGTPTVFINGKRVKIATPESIKKIISHLLDAAK